MNHVAQHVYIYLAISFDFIPNAWNAENVFEYSSSDRHDRTAQKVGDLELLASGN